MSSADSYICTICHIKVKTKLQRAHESGAKHREGLRKLTAPKRPAPSVSKDEQEDDEPVEVKKPRQEPESIHLHSAAAVRQPEAEPEEVTSELPADFFDKSVAEKAAAVEVDMEKEFSKFKSEVERIEAKEAEIDDEEDAVRRDLEMIDEQIEMWRNLNELEKQKEQLVADLHARDNHDAIPEQPAHNEANDSDLSDEDIDVFNLDWRARKI